MNCEICPQPKVCGFYCKDHHQAVCVEGKSPKECFVRVCSGHPPLYPTYDQLLKPNKCVVMVEYKLDDGTREYDCLSVWDTEEDAHKERRRLADLSPTERYWVRITRYNRPY